MSFQVEKPIPYYDAEGKPRGFRTLEAARRLLANEVVTACYGRKGHIKAIFLRKADGSNAVQAEITGGTQYSLDRKSTRLNSSH